MEIAAGVFLLLLAAGAYFVFEHTNLETTQVSLTLSDAAASPERAQSVPGSPKGVGTKRTLRTIVVADLHNNRYGRRNERLLAEIRSREPERILIPGDLVVNEKKSNRIALAFLEELAKLHVPVYYSMGNHECRFREREPEAFDAYRERVRELGIFFLDNERVTDPYGFSVWGLTLPLVYYQKLGKAPELTREALEELLGRAEGANLLLAHNPAFFPAYAAWGAQATLSGHMHGGVARLPLLGGVISPQWKLFPKYDAGKFNLGEAQLYVSRGLGTHTLPLRLFNRPELTELCLSVTLGGV